MFAFLEANTGIPLFKGKLENWGQENWGQT
jgi:hypothetical protein